MFRSVIRGAYHIMTLLYLPIILELRPRPSSSIQTILHNILLLALGEPKENTDTVRVEYGFGDGIATTVRFRPLTLFVHL